MNAPYPHYCAIHRAYYGSPTDTIPATVCPLCGIKAELVAQPAPRAYEVARALSWVDAVESSAAYMPAVNPVALLQSVSHIKKALATYHRLRANKEPAVDALKSIDNAIFNEEHVLNAIAAAPSPATPEAEGDAEPMKLLFSNDWLRSTVPNDVDGEPSAGNVTGMNKRFFVDHGVIHDRKTGQHIGMDAEADAHERLFKLLCELDKAASPTPASGEGLEKLRSWNERYPAGVEMSLGPAKRAERELDAILAELFPKVAPGETK